MDSRPAQDQFTRRRYRCNACGKRLGSIEVPMDDDLSNAQFVAMLRGHDVLRCIIEICQGEIRSPAATMFSRKDSKP